MAEPKLPTRTDSWLGWIYFAGLLLMLSGIFHVIAGLVALFKDEVYLIGPRSLLVVHTYEGWGWIHLIIGVVLIFASLSLFRATVFGRAVGVVLATVSAIINFAFLGAYPLWALLIIVIDVCIIYAIIVHGSQVPPIHADNTHVSLAPKKRARAKTAPKQAS